MTSTVTGTVRAKGLGTKKLRKVVVRSAAGKRATVRLTGSAKVGKAVLKAVKKYRAARGAAKKKLRVRATVKVVLVDAKGNKVTRTVQVTLT